ncbi:hypothetical protein [Saccharopolyspora gloriosae]|uniref:hypothetical protein n=1 Tax=Saccharopolyspora gloriosae TaxID=455344 RepID=UPI001FB712D3|nr:hypothetical protein [Saccharopolyspora gloriosae]
MADFFDRLLDRHAPDREAVLLRPRLPGPFERIESLRTEPPEADVPVAPVVPTSPAVPVFDVLRVEREVRTTDRTTVLHTESPPPEQARPAEPAPRPDAPRPAVHPTIPARATTAEPARPVEPRRDERAQPVVAPSPTGSLRVAAAAPVAADAPRTRIAAAAASRTAAPAHRRSTESAPPPAVHVEIGRLEVTAARPQRRPGSAGPQRRDPAVNLADYLSERATS